MTVKRALVIFSGGQDSTTCLLQALRDYGEGNVEAISFNYGQRHHIELTHARAIAHDLNVKLTVLDTRMLQDVTDNALMDDTATIQDDGPYPNTFVDGRNALFLLLAGAHAKRIGVHDIILGVCETDFSGYPDCRDVFVKAMNVSMNLAMDYSFDVKTPLMFLTKAETWALADELGHLDYVQTHTHTCYLGVVGGCHECPSCVLREQGLQDYLASIG